MASHSPRRRARGTGRVWQPTYRDRQGQLRLANTWAVRYYDRRAHRYREERGFKTEASAERTLRKRLRAQEETGDVGTDAERTLLEDLAQLVVDDYVVNRRDTLRDVRRHVKLLKEAFAFDRAVDVTAERIAAYARRRLEQKGRRGANITAATVNRELATLKRMFRLGLRAGAVTRVPYIPHLEERNVRKGFFEREQLDAVLPHLPKDLRPVVEVAYLTGWRVHSELLTRQWQHVDFDAGVMRIEPGEAKDAREGRAWPLDAELRPLLERQRVAARALGRRLERIIPWVFFHDVDGRPVRRGAFRSAWRDACRKAGVPGKLLHDFRRTAVRNLERAGVPRSTAMALVGHRTEAIYRRYAIVDERMLLEGTERLAQWHQKQRG